MLKSVEMKNKKLETKIIYSIFIFAFIIRLFALLFLPNLYFQDSETYIQSGIHLFNKGYIKYDNVMPIYPIYTYILGKNINIKIFDILVSSLNVVLIFKIAKILFNNINISILAGIISSIYPFFIFYSISILSENLYINFILLIFISLYNRNYLIAFILITLSILLRPILDLIAIPLIFIFSYYIHKISFHRIKYLILKYIFVYSLLMSPWWIHQKIKYGEFIRLNLGDGIVLYSGNNKLNKSGGGAIDIEKGADVNNSIFAKIKNPVLKNEEMKKEALIYIKSDPIHFLKMMYIKFIRFWRLWPYSSIYEKPIFIIISIMSYGTCLIFSILFLIKINRINFIKIMPIIILISYICLIHIITISSIRYRLPIEPFLIIFASHYLINNLSGIKLKKIKLKYWNN
jgi:hypothetical protein